ncbi:J domain-containing protein 1 [Colletotrichum truncatum]|uniref:J domain-containing protein 1 n=1 Tax=Colletotrichum truncatum TaxID=5467 RepID=A0ACC3Z381_COLTU|nr:J domain-containing protein 1 [Colletotrichum truncatum]KAF6793143.1 J domain-containing protein 1 [Colletotrichum truncatum]
MALAVKWNGVQHSLLKAHRRYMHSDRRNSQLKSARHLNDKPIWPQSPYPSPNEILAVEPGMPYSKKHFYWLVKLYHPDHYVMGDKDVAHIPRATRIERYRLVIEANKILNDPEKRLLYEKYGVGWASPNQRSRHVPRSSDFAEAHNTYRSPPYSQNPQPERQFPIFASNTVVAIILVAIAMAGAVVQLERARKAQWDYKKRDLALQEAISRDLQNLAERLEGKPRDMRILEFLARRELSSLTTRDAAFPGFDQDDMICRH